MEKLDKVIERLEYCAETRDGFVQSCVNDAIELLKNHEPKAVDGMFTIRYGSCPNCLKPIDSDVNPKACGHCGQAVKWK